MHNTKRTFLALAALLVCTACDPLLTIEPDYLFEPCVTDDDCEAHEVCAEHAENDRANADASCREPCFDDWECGENRRCGELGGELVCLYQPDSSVPEGGVDRE